MKLASPKMVLTQLASALGRICANAIALGVLNLFQLARQQIEVLQAVYLQ